MGGGEGWGEVGDSRAPAGTHLTLPTASRQVPSLAPLKEGEGDSTIAVQLSLDGFENTGQIVHHLIIPESDDAVPAAGQLGGP